MLEPLALMTEQSLGHPGEAASGSKDDAQQPGRASHPEVLDRSGGDFRRLDRRLVRLDGAPGRRRRWRGERPEFPYPGLVVWVAGEPSVARLNRRRVPAGEPVRLRDSESRPWDPNHVDSVPGGLLHRSDPGDEDGHNGDVVSCVDEGLRFLGDACVVLE